MNRLFGRPARLTLAAAAALLLGPLAGRLPAAEGRLALNDREYFQQRGLDVLVFSREYNGMFFDEKRPDFPESQEDWPFLWGENEYVVDICAHWIFLANAANDLLRE